MSEYAPYDYAWKTSGWTVQNPAYTPSVNTYVDPGLPTDVSKVRVFGTFLDLNSGLPQDGVFRVKARTSNGGPLKHIPSGSLVFPHSFPLRFTQGAFSLLLPATDDPDLTPAFVYDARLTVAGRTTEFTFSLPASVPEKSVFDLIDLATPLLDDNVIDGGTP